MSGNRIIQNICEVCFFLYCYFLPVILLAPVSMLIQTQWQMRLEVGFKWNHNNIYVLEIELSAMMKERERETFVSIILFGASVASHITETKLTC